MNPNFCIKMILDYLNHKNLSIMVDFYDEETGTIHLSNEQKICINELEVIEDLEKYL